MKKKEKAAAKPRRNVLGMGLDALLPDTGSVEPEPSAYFFCRVAAIRPNRFQPRKHFGEEELSDLSESIKKQGVLQPLIVRASGNKFELVAGERRLRAAKLAGLDEVPVMKVDVTEAEMLQMAIVENIQREDLNPMEECQGYHRLISEFALTQEQVADRVGKKRSTVANFLRLRNLPPQIQDSLSSCEISMGHARALLGIENRPRQILAWKAVCSKGLSVRATEDLVEQLKNDNPTAKPNKKSPDAIHFGHMAEELSRSLGTKVKISKKGKKGKLVIEFYSDDDLERLMDLFKVT